MENEPDPHLTELLAAARTGDEAARVRFFEAVYGNLHGLARREFRREARGHTLQPTALVNEAWLRLEGAGASFENQAHFFRTAARAMRRILIDHARRCSAEKRGEGQRPVTLTEVDDPGNALSVLELDDALQALERSNPRLAELVQLRFFGGLTIDEIARVQKTSPATVKRDWTYARAWLYRNMRDSSE